MDMIADAQYMDLGGSDAIQNWYDRIDPDKKFSSSGAGTDPHLVGGDTVEFLTGDYILSNGQFTSSTDTAITVYFSSNVTNTGHGQYQIYDDTLISGDESPRVSFDGSTYRIKFVSELELTTLTTGIDAGSDHDYAVTVDCLNGEATSYLDGAELDKITFGNTERLNTRKTIFSFAQTKAGDGEQSLSQWTLWRQVLTESQIAAWGS